MAVIVVQRILSMGASLPRDVDHLAVHPRQLLAHLPVVAGGAPRRVGRRGGRRRRAAEATPPGSDTTRAAAGGRTTGSGAESDGVGESARAKIAAKRVDASSTSSLHAASMADVADAAEVLRATRLVVSNEV